MAPKGPSKIYWNMYLPQGWGQEAFHIENEGQGLFSTIDLEGKYLFASKLFGHFLF